MTIPPIISTARLLAILNEGSPEPIGRSTLHTWLTTDPKWRGCIAHASRRKYWLSTARLRAVGVLPAEPTPVAAPHPGPAFAYTVRTA